MTATPRPRLPSNLIRPPTAWNTPFGGLLAAMIFILLMATPKPATATCFDLIACPQKTAQRDAEAALIPVVAGTEVMHVEHMLHMDLKRLLALGSGLAFGRFFAETVFESGHEIGFFFMIVGALFGEMLYQKEIWPFTPSEPVPDRAGDHSNDTEHDNSRPTHTEVRRGNGYPLLYVPVPRDKPFPTR